MTTIQRCTWANSTPLMSTYHDKEWGVPEHNSRMLWETLMLEGFQAGLSWSIILRKRETFREAFLDFDPKKVAKFGEREIEILLVNPGIVRSRAKILATINGARLFNEMEARGEHFNTFCWSFTEGKVLKGDGKTIATQTPLSVTIAKELKRRGFKFVGPSIVYAWMQAIGIVNDHSTTCFRRKQVKSSPAAIP